MDIGTHEEVPKEKVEHRCSNNAFVLDCDDVTDVWKCRVCGKIWEKPCNFDDDYN